MVPVLRGLQGGGFAMPGSLVVVVRRAFLVTMVVAVARVSWAQSTGSGKSATTGSQSSDAATFGSGAEGQKPSSRMPTARIPAAVSRGGYWWSPWWTPPVFYGPYYPFGIAPTYPPPPITLTMTHPSAFVIPGFGVAIPPPAAWNGVPWSAPAREGLAAPAVVERNVAANDAVAAGRADAAARALHRRTERVAEHLKVGDRLFRVNELGRAERRYQEAVQANPNIAEPHLRLAQVSIARKDYADAAQHIHDAQTAEPGWQLTARPRDVQNLFGDPARFVETLAAIESHLQANPEDRDAWLVLGTELYLTGRTQRAHDAFLRLTDRKADPTLAGFLEMMPPPPQ